MRQMALWAVIAGMIVTSSCARSIHPLYTSEDLVSDGQLQGRWSDGQATSEVWDVRQDGSGYVAAKQGDAELEELSIHVVSIGRSLFLDVAPKNTSLLAIEGHVFLKMHFEGDELVLEALDWNWLQDKATEAGLTQFETPDHQRVLTAPTSDLQRFLAMYADDPQAFDPDVDRLHRVR